jgi:hypothetical protein
VLQKGGRPQTESVCSLNATACHGRLLLDEVAVTTKGPVKFCISRIVANPETTPTHCFTDGSRPAGELEQLWSRVGICELLPGLSEYEARQMIQRTLGRIPESTTKQILRQTGNSIRKLTKMLERLKELKEVNEDRALTELISVAGQSALGLTR